MPDPKPAKPLPRPNKHKPTQAQLEREAKQRRQRVLRRVGVLAAVALILAVGVLVVSRSSGGTDESAPNGSATPQSNAELLSTAALAAKEAGCSPVKNVGAFNEKDDGSHEGARPLAEYPSVPPASGPHLDSTIAAGVYEEPIEMGPAIHSLEHGAGEIWYSPSVADSPEIASIAAWVEATPENTDHAVMSPYDYPAEGASGSLPGKAQMALVAWHNVMLCDQPSLPVVVDFMSKYRYPPIGDKDYAGEAPETGVPI